MQVKTQPLDQPIADQQRLVDGIVVPNQVDVQAGRHFDLNGIAELHGSVPLVAAANHLAEVLASGAAKNDTVPWRRQLQVRRSTCPGRMGNIHYT